MCGFAAFGLFLGALPGAFFFGFALGLLREEVLHCFLGGKAMFDTVDEGFEQRLAVGFGAGCGVVGRRGAAGVGRTR